MLRGGKKVEFPQGSSTSQHGIVNYVMVLQKKKNRLKKEQREEEEEEQDYFFENLASYIVAMDLRAA